MAESITMAGLVSQVGQRMQGGGMELEHGGMPPAFIISNPAGWVDSMGLSRQPFVLP